MNKNTKKKSLKALSLAMGGVTLMAGAGAYAAPAVMAQEEKTDAVSDLAKETGAVISLEDRAEETYTKVANVTGDFSCSQEVMVPSDEVFNLFGTAATAMCAKPGFAFEEADTETYYVNVKGNLKKGATVSLKELKEKNPETTNMVCSCSSSASVAQVQVTGVPVSSIIEMAELEENVNTVTFKSADGYGIPMPLSYVLEKEALLVYQVNGKDINASQGGPVQVWMPSTVAKYFTRQVVEIELTAEEEVPAVMGLEDEQRAKVSIVNRVSNETFHVGDGICFEGYADDCGVAIEAVEFSMDGGETWTVCSTEGASEDAWVYWHFGYVCEEAGTYKLDVRARTAEGTVSPLAASVVFQVEE